MTNFNWYFTRDEIDNKTPSREDGVTLSTEIRYRREGARLIINASNTLGLRYETTATGVVFFHRFYMIQSFRQFNRWVVAAACLLLAGKVEETPKKCRDIIKVSQSLLTEQQMAHFGSNPKDELMTHERILLQTIKFDLQVEHPYAYLLKFAKQLKGDKAKIEKLVQMAWTFMNDSLCTSLCLQWEPQAIAIAFIYLAGKLSKFDLHTATQSRSRSWWRQYLDTVDVHDLESICHQVLDIYGEEEQKSGEEPSLPPQSTPQSTASTPHSAHPQPFTGTPQTLPTFQVPVNQTAQSPVTPHHQYATHYQQYPIPTAHPQQPQTRTTPYGFPSGQTTPLVPGQAVRPVAQTTPAQPGNTPLAYSTLNVNVSATTPSRTVLQQQPPSAVQGSVLPGTAAAAAVGSVTTPYQYPVSFAPGSVPGLRGTSPAAASNLALQQRAGYGNSASSYPVQGYKPMVPLMGSGGSAGQVSLVRPGAATGSVSPAGALLTPRTGVGRGTGGLAVPRALHGLPRARNLMGSQAGYPSAAGRGAPASQLHTQSPIPGSVRPNTASGGTTSWP